jgi:hypothetical protein
MILWLFGRLQVFKKNYNRKQNCSKIIIIIIELYLILQKINKEKIKIYHSLMKEIIVVWRVVQLKI